MLAAKEQLRSRQQRRQRQQQQGIELGIKADHGVQPVGKPGASGDGRGCSSGSGSGSGSAGAGARRWALVRKALESGRLLRLPYDAENYSIVTSTFKWVIPLAPGLMAWVAEREAEWARLQAVAICA
jgi:hypothetical protein